ncbi:hypothetical protein PR048_021697 [Dryococelus australis]|uniref:Uncharacterized protein n=1 Tax=Dryococelus australis TaxID=614101 RepID=A0ABQ9GYX2_9NEOP|nr:hypothetical protein PR048_021697 [Dryococelus australis]
MKQFSTLAVRTIDTTVASGPLLNHENSRTVYRDMLEQFLEPQVVQDDIIHDDGFQRDGTPCHYAYIIQDYLNDQFPDHWIGRGGNRSWAPRAPDLTILDFFAWGSVKA